MKATVEIAKSFDEGRKFEKFFLKGDFNEFFAEEGEYLERLADALEAHGKEGEGFTVTYTVNLSK